MATFVERMLGAARLDAATYEEVEHDQTATGQAAAVVVLSSIAGGIGTASELGAAGAVAGMVVGSLISITGWCVWAFVTYIIGTKVLPGPKTEADMGQMLRTLGFSSSPGLLNILGILPGVGGFVGLLTSIWMLAAMVVAVRQALDYDGTGRAIGVCLIGFLLYMVLIAMTAGLLSSGS